MSKAQFNLALQCLGDEVSSFTNVEMRTKRSFLPFYRSITNIPMRRAPKWSYEPNIEELIPALMIGSWSADYVGDKEAIEALSGMCYEEYIKKLKRWIDIEDSPILNISNNYQIVSPQDMWTFLFSLITPGDFEQFDICFHKIFSAIDPTFELPEEQWPTASIMGKKLDNSSALRQGIIITLVMISESGEDVNQFSTSCLDDFSYRSVKKVLESVQSWQQWNTIALSLPMFTEASPQAVIDKLETESENEDSELWKLLIPSTDSFWGTNYYTYVLWSLEILSSYSSYSVRSIMLLAKFSEKKYEYRLSNSPIKSLYELFCLWNPQIGMCLDDRLKLLKKICEVYQDTGRNLLGKLLPSEHQISGSVYRPQWRLPDLNCDRGVAVNEYQSSVKFTLDLCIDKCTNSRDGWDIIISNIGLFYDYYSQIEECLITYMEDIEEDNAILICNILRERISYYREYDSDVDVQSHYYDKLEGLLYKIIPVTINKYKYLFGWNPPLLNPIKYNLNLNSRGIITMKGGEH